MLFGKQNKLPHKTCIKADEHKLSVWYKQSMGTAAHLHKQDGAVVETSTLHLHRTGRYYGAAYSRLFCFQNLTIFAVFLKQEAR